MLKNNFWKELKKKKLYPSFDSLIPPVLYTTEISFFSGWPLHDLILIHSEAQWGPQQTSMIELFSKFFRIFFRRKLILLKTLFLILDRILNAPLNIIGYIRSGGWVVMLFLILVIFLFSIVFFYFDILICISYRLKFRRY